MLGVGLNQAFFLEGLARSTPILASTESLNKELQAKFADTFVKYYELVGTQWPSDPRGTSFSPTPIPLSGISYG